MGSVFSAPSRISHAASSTSQATQVFTRLASEDTDLRAHHPASLGGTINSARMTLDSIRTTVDAIDIPQISFYAKIAGVVVAYTAIQSILTQKRIASSLEGLAKDLSRHAEIKHNSHLAGNQGENNTNLYSQSFIQSLQDSLSRSSILQTKLQKSETLASFLPIMRVTSQMPTSTTVSPIQIQHGSISIVKPASSRCSMIGPV